MKANFIMPVGSNGLTDLPMDKDGKRLVEGWWHLTPVVKGSVVVQVRASETVIGDMKKNAKYLWLEDLDEKDPGLTVACDAALVKSFVDKSAAFAKAAIDKLPWETPSKAVESVVKLHGQDMAGYRKSGLG